MMFPTSWSADSPSSVPASTPRSEQRTSASRRPKRSSTIASSSPTIGSTTPVVLESGSPSSSTASERRSATVFGTSTSIGRGRGAPTPPPAPERRSATVFGTSTSIGRPTSRESAVAALPEPMFASSRSASSSSSVKVVFTLFLLGCCGETGRAAAIPDRDRVAVDDQGDVAVGEHCAAGDRAAVADLGRQRARDQLALADQAVDGERDAVLRGAHDDSVGAVAEAFAPERVRGVDERERAVAQDEHALAGDGADRVLVEPERALDAVERHGEREPSRLDEQRGHDRERQRQADLRDGSLAVLGRHQHLAAELA